MEVRNIKRSWYFKLYRSLRWWRLEQYDTGNILFDNKQVRDFPEYWATTIHKQYKT